MSKVCLEGGKSAMVYCHEQQYFRSLPPSSIPNYNSSFLTA